MNRFKSLYITIPLVVLFLCLMSCVGIRYGCIQGNCTNGQGTFTTTDGHKYVGEFKDGKLNGQGTYTFPDGEKYVGEYKDGNRNGYGTYTFPDGRVKRGIWKNNEFVKLVEQDSNQTSVKTNTTIPVLLVRWGIGVCMSKKGFA